MKSPKDKSKSQRFYEALGQLSTPFDVPLLGAGIDKKTTPVPREPTDIDWRIESAKAFLRDAASGLQSVGRHVWTKSTRRAYLAFFVFAAIAGGMTVFTTATQTLAQYGGDISSPAALAASKATGTTILDRNGKLLYRYGSNNQEPVALSALPKDTVNATLAAEDPTFYDHAGISWRSMGRALYVDVRAGGAAEGGSTLTQQLVKNTLLTQQKSVIRKYREIVLAVAMEHRYNKDQIMDMYVNNIYYGQGSYGIQAAARTYFHKDAKDLDLSQSAILAGLPLGPNRFDPSVFPEAAAARRDYVLSRMHQLGYITADQEKAASSQPIQASQQEIPLNAPHFVFYVLDQLRKTYGDELVEKGGLTVTTTLDLNRQQMAQQIVYDQIARLSHNHVTNGNLLAMDPHNGQILAMVGSYDYGADGYGNVNTTLTPLQPGSSFKPVAYALSFIKGWNGATQVQDTPVSVPNGDGTNYQPHNYDLKFRGAITIRRALGNSLNIPAIRAEQYIGLDNLIDFAHTMGITTFEDRPSYGLSLVLGGAEVKPIDMATVYSAFANGGTRYEPQSIIKVTDKTGKDRTKTEKSGVRVLDERIAYMITNILSDDNARSEEFGLNSPLKLSRPAAAKTGTTNDWRDNWTIGYTPDLVSVVWAGNNDHSSMLGVNGITGAAPIWHEFMERALTGTPVQPFVAPSGITTAKVCSRDGGLANPWDSGYNEIFLTGQVETRHCASTAPAPPPTDPAKPDQAQPDPAKPTTTDNPFFPNNPEPKPDKKKP